MMELNIPQKFRDDINTAVEILREEGCQAIYLFGSLVTGKIHDKSDIDIGIRGLPHEKFYRVYGKLDDSLSCNVDLVDFDDYESFYTLLQSIDEVVQIG
ncbi:MAG: nucleotidyltransferase domain-containing protein [Candidatus Cloacimonetes bacterium]|nr:nucleotidyltransferase domain-containing protein [Candidatus Cloacimonadota bacterium]